MAQSHTQRRNTKKSTKPDASPDLHSKLVLYGIPVQGLIESHAELRLKPSVPFSVRWWLKGLWR